MAKANRIHPRSVREINSSDRIPLCLICRGHCMFGIVSSISFQYLHLLYNPVAQTTDESFVINLLAKKVQSRIETRDS